MFLGLVSLCLLAVAVNAQEGVFFLGEELGVGSRAIGMGGAYVGISDDYSAMYWNPAGMGQLQRMEVNLGFSHNKFVNETSFLGYDSKAEDTFSRINSIGIVFPVPTYQGSLVLGIGYNKIRDFDNRLDIAGFNPDSIAYDDFFYQTAPPHNYTDVLTDLWQEQSIIEEGSLNQFSLAASMELQKDFFLGATVNFIGGKDDYSMDFAEEDIYDLYDTFQIVGNDTIISDLHYWNYSQSIISNYKAVNLKLGAMYRYGNVLRLGATIITPTTFTIKEQWSDQWTEVYDDGFSYNVPPEPGEYTYKIQEPYAFAFGASFKFLNFLFSADAEFKDWSQAKFVSEPPIEGEDKKSVNNRIAKDFKSVTKIHLGAEMYIPIIRAKVRAGYFTDPSPYRYTDVRPDKDYISAGASLMLDKQVMVDLGYTIGTWEQETIDVLTNAPTLEKKSLQKLIGTLSVRF